MKLRIVSWLAALAVALLAAGCGARDTASSSRPHVTPEIQVPPLGPTTLTVRAVSCHTLTECRAYVSWNRPGEPTSEEVRLDGDADALAAGWPTPIDPGSYVIHFRWVMVSDAIVNGVADETTVATCEEQVLVQGIHLSEAIELLVRLDDGRCVITQTASTADQ